MSGDEPEGDKQFEPSQKRLEDARRKGDVPRSADLTTAAGYGGFLIASLAFGPAAVNQLGSVLSDPLDRATDLSAVLFGGESGASLVGLAGGIISAAAPFFVLPAALAVLSILAQQGPVLAPEKLMPKLSRLSPAAALSNKFGRGGLFEFGKSLAKMTIYSGILGWYLMMRLPDLLGTPWLTAGQIGADLGRLVSGLLLLVLGVALVIGLLDLLFQHANHRHRHRMTRKEMIDEHKESDGDPNLKAQRRQKGISIAMRQMLAEVPKADVVIVNPTHYAVALTWNRLSGRAPVCVAKGVDDIALRIREVAALHRVPIHSDPATARALYATLEIGAEIRRDHFRAVAAAIRFAERIRKTTRPG